MNFLTLVQRLRRRCRVSGTGPSTVVSQNEEYARLVDWTNEAWMEIQLERPDWKWMRSSMSFPTVAAQSTYTLAQIQATGTGFSSFGNWDKDTFRNYSTASGTNSEIDMNWLDYDQWRDVYAFGGNRATQTRPTEFAISPAQGICLGPFPTTGYTVSGDYFKVASEMTADADIPLLPTEFQMAIVYKAMMFYGASEAASEVYEEGHDLYQKMMRRVEWQQLPTMQSAGALA